MWDILQDKILVRDISVSVINYVTAYKQSAYFLFIVLLSHAKCSTATIGNILLCYFSTVPGYRLIHS